MAQRTGATTYYLEVFPVPLAQLGTRRPVFGLNPLPGRLDALVITSSSRALTTAEKMALGDGRRDEAQLLQLVRDHSRAHHVLDMSALTREAGTVVSAVMLGAIAASGLLRMGNQASVHTEAMINQPLGDNLAWWEKSERRARLRDYLV